MLAWLRGRFQNLAVYLERMLNRFLKWLFASRDPAVVYVRELIRSNAILRSGARRLIRGIYLLPMLPARLGRFFGAWRAALAGLRMRLWYAGVFLVSLLNRFLEWMFSSRQPAVVYIREFIRRNDTFLFAARRFIRAVRRLPTFQEQLREFFSRPAGPVTSIMAARQIGGSITVPELEQIWGLTRNKRTRVLAIAAEPELEQIRAIVSGTRPSALFHSAVTPEEINVVESGEWDLIVAVPAADTEQQLAALQKRVRMPTRIFRFGEASKRSDYFEQKSIRDDMAGGAGIARPSAGQNAAGRGSLRVVFLNDVGFQYGAGIALRRQAASFLLQGFEVHLVAWTPGIGVKPPAITGIADLEGWRGVHNLSKDHPDRASVEKQIVAGALSTIRAIDPDVIVTGNLHGTGFPLELAQGLKTVNALVVSYMHDCFWATGRCAYPVSCQLYQTGCNETCPTADEYPKLMPDKIGPAWRTKADIFEGETGIPLVTNSSWTRDIAVRRFGNRARVDCVPLALDHELFAPIPKAVARRLLGLPPEGAFVVLGAIDIFNKWKGGSLFRDIHDRLQNRSDVSVLLFGQSSAMLKSTKSFGLVEDERLMPLILNAADIFVGTATEEAFGQTLLEAAACGIPVVAFDRGGVSDVVVDELTGLLVKNLSVDELCGAIDRLLADPSLRDLLGRNARKRVESHFTLARQADAWSDYLGTLSSLHRRSTTADVTNGL